MYVNAGILKVNEIGRELWLCWTFHLQELLMKTIT